MTIENFINTLPNYAQDIKDNLKLIFKQTSLPQTDLHAVALAISYSLRHEQLLNAIRSSAKLYLEEQDATDCKIAAITMSMTNVFYHFHTNINDENIKQMPANLVLNNLKNHQNQVRFEMSCLGVSILNGCAYCINVHIKKLQSHGIDNIMINDIAKLASILKAARDVLEIERLRNYIFIPRDAAI